MVNRCHECLFYAMNPGCAHPMKFEWLRDAECDLYWFLIHYMQDYHAETRIPPQSEIKKPNPLTKKILHTAPPPGPEGSQPDARRYQVPWLSRVSGPRYNYILERDETHFKASVPRGVYNKKGYGGEDVGKLAANEFGHWYTEEGFPKGDNMADPFRDYPHLSGQLVGWTDSRKMPQVVRDC